MGTLYVFIYIYFSFISGVFAGAMAKRYGFRFVMMLGAFIAALGFITSFWVKDIVVLFLTMGLLVGMNVLYH